MASSAGPGRPCGRPLGARGAECGLRRSANPAAEAMAARRPSEESVAGPSSVQPPSTGDKRKPAAPRSAAGPGPDPERPDRAALRPRLTLAALHVVCAAREIRAPGAQAHPPPIEGKRFLASVQQAQVVRFDEIRMRHIAGLPIPAHSGWDSETSSNYMDKRLINAAGEDAYRRITARPRLNNLTPGTSMTKIHGTG